MASARGLPDIPGMWYDATRNRYFRITQESRAPPPPPVGESEKTCTRKVARSSSLAQFLRRAEEGRDAKTAQALPAALLANTKPVSFEVREHPRGTDMKQTQMRDAIALLGNDKRIEICAYPTLDVEDSYDMDHTMLNMKWSWPPGLLAATSCTLYGNEVRYKLLACAFGKNREDRYRRLIVLFDIEEYPHAVAIENLSGNFAVSGETVTQRVGRTESMTFQHPDLSSGLSVVTMSNSVLTGTRAGNVFKWDVRMSPGHPVCSFRPSANYCAVTDMKHGADEQTLYISCMRNKRSNLAKWDMRKCDGKPDPVIVFRGHSNSHKKLKFDVDETASGGLLLAGGDDSVVRVWSTQTGGPGTACAQFPGEIPKRVKLAGWGRDSDAPPGAWIITNAGNYIMASGRDSQT